MREQSGDMRVWGQERLDQASTASVARRALEGTSRAGLIREGVKVLLESGCADRVGVWLEGRDETSRGTRKSFSGLTADMDGSKRPSEWSTLDIDTALPSEIVSAVRGVEQEPGGRGGQPRTGALKGMVRVLWLPVETRGHLRGVIFAGQRDKRMELPWSTARAVAAELGLALELQDERRKGEAHRGNIAAIRVSLEALNKGKAAEEGLREIVEECTRDPRSGAGPLAVFAAIGRAVPPARQSHSGYEEER